MLVDNHWDILSCVATLDYYLFKTTYIFVTSLLGCQCVDKDDPGNPQTLMMIPHRVYYV